MTLKSWGNYPSYQGQRRYVSDKKAVKTLIAQCDDVVAQGAHKSYGDSAFAPQILNMLSLDCFLDFDSVKGVLRCQSGVVFADILDIVVPKGWILPVLPGTKNITVGGAIASDIHGKNHHAVGCFGDHVITLTLMLADGQVVKCSNSENRDLFEATCGGMGLTGVILEASIALMPITSSRIRQTVLKANNLKNLFEAFDQHMDSHYSVAWIDALADGQDLGKGVLLLGEHHNDHDFTYKQKQSWSMPFFWPRWFLNRFSIKVFNWLYFTKSSQSPRTVGIDAFFFPLDAIHDWNKCYGKKGLLQYQFVLPLSNSLAGVSEILKAIHQARQVPFLTVLKRLGAANDHLLSFPLDGYTLAIDFKVSDAVLKLLEYLDEIVVKHGGRIYLCKDARMPQSVFDAGYEKAVQFRQLRHEYALHEKFNSRQSRRLGL